MLVPTCVGVGKLYVTCCCTVCRCFINSLGPMDQPSCKQDKRKKKIMLSTCKLTQYHLSGMASQINCSLHSSGNPKLNFSMFILYSNKYILYWLWACPLTSPEPNEDESCRELALTRVFFTSCQPRPNKRKLSRKNMSTRFKFEESVRESVRVAKCAQEFLPNESEKLALGINSQTCVWPELKNAQKTSKHDKNVSHVTSLHLCIIRGRTHNKILNSWE